jgi:hypothetical protein
MKACPNQRGIAHFPRLQRRVGVQLCSPCQRAIIDEPGQRSESYCSTGKLF